jgi:hypothetical protein
MSQIPNYSSLEENKFEKKKDEKLRIAFNYACLEFFILSK